MASISLLCNCYFTSFSNKTASQNPNFSPASIIPMSIKRYRKQNVLCCSNGSHVEKQQQEEPFFFWCKEESAGRREVLFSIPFTGNEFRVYTDDANKFQTSIPQDWQVGVGEPREFKSVTAFYPEESTSSNVSVVIWGLGPDFTRMESFGKVEAFAETLVSGLDRSWQRPPGVAAKFIDCKSANGIYYIEYTLQNPGESRIHLFSALGMAFNGWYNRIYTVTGQYMEEESETYGSEVQKVVSSFRFI